MRKGNVNAKVVRREGEDVESLLRRFKRKVNDADVLHDMKKHEFYLSPSQKDREKRKEAELKRRKFERAQRRFTRPDDYKPTYKPRTERPEGSANGTL